MSSEWDPEWDEVFRFVQQVDRWQYKSLVSFVQGADKEQQEALKAWARKIIARDHAADSERVLKFYSDVRAHYGSQCYPYTVDPFEASLLCEEADNVKGEYEVKLERLKGSGLIERIGRRDREALRESSKYESSRIVTALIFQGSAIEDPVEYASQEYARTNFYSHTMETAPFPLNRRVVSSPNYK